MADRPGVVYENERAGFDGNGHRSAKDILESIVGDVQEIIRSEVRLARTEMKEEAVKAGKAGGMFGGAAVVGLMALACLVTCGIAALALAMPVWLAALLMSVFCGCIAAGLFAGGRSKMKEVKPVPEQTVQTLKDDVAWAKQQRQ